MRPQLEGRLPPRASLTGAWEAGGRRSQVHVSSPAEPRETAARRQSLNKMSGCLRGRDRERIEGELHEGRVYGRFAVVLGKACADGETTWVRRSQKGRPA